MGASRTLLRKLDHDLIARIEASGRPEKPRRSTKKKAPRAADSYRGARRNDDRVKGWPSATFAKSRPLAHPIFIPLNRSDKWSRAKSYAYAREISPSAEPVR